MNIDMDCCHNCYHLNKYKTGECIFEGSVKLYHICHHFKRRNMANLYRLGKRVLTKYGAGTIISDTDGDCSENEVLVKLDKSFYAGVVGGGKYANLRKHNVELFYKSELIFMGLR